jgi:hypothetical protein
MLGHVGGGSMSVRARGGGRCQRPPHVAIELATPGGTAACCPGGLVRILTGANELSAAGALLADAARRAWWRKAARRRRRRRAAGVGRCRVAPRRARATSQPCPCRADGWRRAALGRPVLPPSQQARRRAGLQQGRPGAGGARAGRRPAAGGSRVIRLRMPAPATAARRRTPRWRAAINRRRVPRCRAPPNARVDRPRG